MEIPVDHQGRGHLPQTTTFPGAKEVTYLVMVYPPLVEMSHVGETRGGSSHPMTMIISDPNIGWLPCCFCWSYHCLFAWIMFHHFFGASKGAIFDGATCRLPAWLVFISTFIATCTKYWVAWQHGLAKDGVFQPMDRLKGKSAGRGFLFKRHVSSCVF